ncbi:unnamed protein product [Lactuca saligna]|uniref:Arabidopsis retrotransposon Orf1 C-terminal domain-containing protein n=1 Tax=Lactuca saligna TaxID=75948 RepID=A0AA36EK21_LACSI|nr:unnamed protein product [Lactuca saligna]
MLELLSSISFDYQTHLLTFRLLNQTHQFHADILSDMIGSPKARRDIYTAKGRKNVVFEQDCANFWRNISCEYEYQSGTAKASSIIHPVLKVAHRIIASLLFPQEEISKANKKELEVLWCMINKPAEVPHFGCWVIQKMLRSATSNGGQLHCGGMVSIIAEHLGLHLPNNPTNIIMGRTRLSIDVMETMHLFHRLPTGDIHWTVDGKEYIRIDNRNKKILNLANDIPSTNWKLRSNLGVTVDHSPPSSPPPAPTAGASSSSRPIPFSEHNLYMGEFARLNHRYTSLQQEVGDIYTGVAEITSDFQDYRNLQEENWAQQELRWAEQDQRWATQEQHNRNIHHLLSDIHRVLVLPTQSQQPSASQPQWPPYYPTDYPSRFPPYPPPVLNRTATLLSKHRGRCYTLSLGRGIHPCINPVACRLHVDLYILH